MGKVLGLIFGLMLLPRMGFLGMLLGMVVGYWFDKGLKQNLYTHKQDRDTHNEHASWSSHSHRSSESYQQRYRQRQYQPPPFNEDKRHTDALNLRKAYQLLQVDMAANFEAVKKAYRKQTSQYHPDKLASKDLPEDMLKMAHERTQDIRRAYEFICKQRGWQA